MDKRDAACQVAAAMELFGSKSRQTNAFIKTLDPKLRSHVTRIINDSMKRAAHLPKLKGGSDPDFGEKLVDLQRDIRKIVTESGAIDEMAAEISNAANAAGIKDSQFEQSRVASAIKADLGNGKDCEFTSQHYVISYSCRYFGSQSHTVLAGGILKIISTHVSSSDNLESEGYDDHADIVYYFA